MSKFVNDKGNFTLDYIGCYGVCTPPDRKWSGLPLFANVKNGDFIAAAIELRYDESGENGTKELVLIRAGKIEEIPATASNSELSFIQSNGLEYSFNFPQEIARFPYTDEGADEMCDLARELAKARGLKPNSGFPMFQMTF